MNICFACFKFRGFGYALCRRGSAISKVIGENTQESDLFENDVRMWVFEEILDGRKLSEIINQDHENVKYLPGIKLPKNVVCWMGGKN